MRRFVESTPCPAPHLSTGATRDYTGNQTARDSRRMSMNAPAYSTDGDTTANIEYTTEIPPRRLRNERARRPARSMRASAFNPGQDIFEDVAQEEQAEAALEMKRRSKASIVSAGVEKNSTILARKAQRIHMPAPEVKDRQAKGLQAQKPQRRRVSQLLNDRYSTEGDATVQLYEESLEKRELRKQGPKKDPRRRTIYVPSEDTSMFTIHPGQPTHKPRNPREQSPDIGLDLVTLSEEDTESLVSAMKKEKKAPRKSLAAPPRRALSHIARQETSYFGDVMGAGGGKENIPPRMEVFEDKKGTHISFDFSRDDEPRKPALKASKVHFSGTNSVTSSQAKSRVEGTQKRLRHQLSHDGTPVKSIKAKADSVASSTRTASTRTSVTTKSSVRTVKTRPSAKPSASLPSSSPFHTDRSPPTALRRRKIERGPMKIEMMHEVGRPAAPPRETYPVLTEDLARPELYEDNWLTQQEIAITQLINSMFDVASKDPNAEQSTEELRGKLLAMYHEPSISPLHKRLQASLQYGALSIPKDLLAQSLRLKDDVGMRKKFLNLWVKTYDLTSLRAAAEVIIGRQITVPSRLSSGSTSSDDGSRVMRTERRAIENFLDTFLIRNEDAIRVKGGAGSVASIVRGDRGDQGDEFGSPGWSWRRTALRSLMLIYLLDKAKSADALSGCLFLSSSPYKTSTDVLHALSNILLPSHGDITRPLGHLNYKVDHVQYALQEYTYHIDNIAIDFRDGVILTRLVELLLYSPSMLALQQEDTVTITMPTGEILSSTVDSNAKESWVLSQHLKFPSIGRAQKLYNVQIALAALDGVRGLPLQVVGGITPMDIVNGHREKTLSLLWSLVGKHGLGTLVNWAQLSKETERFRTSWYSRRDNYEQRDLDSEDDEPTSQLTGLEHHKRLLLSWARSVARTHGLRVTNLTTSFANPVVLEAIVDTYLPPTLAGIHRGYITLAEKLKATGCSTSFTALFASTRTSIPSKDFTLLTLAFLASRLLPLNITHRAATTIQRAYRGHLARRNARQRVVNAQIAHEKAVSAKARERLVGAAVVVQRRWRAVLQGRNEVLEGQVAAFQALARGWVVRRWARRVTGGKVGGKEKVRRVRGGW